jgi:hypothetical protein
VSRWSDPEVWRRLYDAHFSPRYVGDRFEDGPIDPREPWLPNLPPEEFEAFAAGLRAALERD